MAGTLVLQTLSDGTNSTSATNPIKGSAKAWVNFNGTGTVAIRGSYNVSSVTDLGTGSYAINFTNAMTNTNYCVVGSSTSVVGVAVTTVINTFRRDTDVRVDNTTTSTTISVCNTQNSVSLDAADVNIVVFDS